MRPSLLIPFLLASTAACAHDTALGHSRRTLHFADTPAGLVIEMRVALSFEEALVEMTRADADRDGSVSVVERDAWFARRGKDLADALLVTTDTGRAAVRFERFALDAGPTQTYRFLVEKRAELYSLDDRGHPDKPGTVRVLAGPGLTVEAQRAVDLSHADRVLLSIRRTDAPGKEPAP